MVYRKNYRRRSRRSRRAWYDRKYSAKDLALKALKNTRYLRGLVNSEMFHNDDSVTANAVNSTTGIVKHLTDIAQGDSDTGRTGNSILVRSLLNRVRFKINASATTTIVRFMLVIDTQQVADTTPVMLDILQLQDVDAPLNKENAGRFKVLMNKTISLTTNNSQYHLEKFLNMYHHVRYNGTASSDITKGGLYFVALSDQTTNTPTLDGWWRLGYHDN